MLINVIKFVKLPLLLLTIFTIARFSLGVYGVPYAPRGNAMFSIVGLTLISSIYFGALSGRVGGFNIAGAALIGFVIGLFAQILIFTATFISYQANLNTYFIHWDALNVPEGTQVPMMVAMGARARGLIFGAIFGALFALLGRLLGILAPNPATLPGNSK